MARTFHPKRMYPRAQDTSAFEGHGAALLLLIRNEGVKTWTTLCKAFGFDPRHYHSGHLSLKNTIERLVDVRLLESKNGFHGPYKLTSMLDDVLSATGLSLTQAANLPYHEGMATQPHFGKAQRWSKAPHVFVAMPFHAELTAVYKGPISQACRDLRLSTERADDIFSASPVVSDIWEAICNCGVVVADCTTRNANVFYEIGIAHAVGKSVILISQAKDDVPFDLSYIRFIEYETSKRGLASLRKSLRETLKLSGAGVWSLPPNR